MKSAVTLVVGLLCLSSAPVLAATECQPLFDAYAAQQELPIYKRIITTPGMADPVEMILTQEALFSRVGVNDTWSRLPLDTPTRTMMLKGMPTEASVTDCRRTGSETIDGKAVTTYSFAPSPELGNAPGEMLTVSISDESHLPLIETASIAGTSVAMTYDGITAPQP